MKFIHYLESITGIGIYPLVSLIIFVVFFMIVTIYVFKADKKYFNEVKNIPLDKKD